LWITTLWDGGGAPLQWGVVIGASLGAARYDLATGRIPNLLTAPLFVTGLSWAAWTGRWAGLADAISASILLALPYITLFVYAGGGAGDAKLMGALGAWLGVVNGAIVLVSVLLCGAVLGFALASATRQLRMVFANLTRIAMVVVFFSSARDRERGGSRLLPKTEEMQTMRYGVAVFAGVCVSAVGVWIWRT
jgi:Flp pilus assembly protein protease CpaA